MKRTGFYLVVLVLVPWESRAEWSVFDPISETAPPQVDDAEWAGPVDALVYLRLKEAGLDPAPAVDRGVWMRRVTYDLVGVPPAAEDVQTLLDDARPDAEAMGDVVDRLLESPRYGERWARHWLDVVRYADTDGFAIDKERLWLWRYRDYVIRVLNEDRPFDQFIREQIAGDELDSGDGGKVAISYYRLGPWEADNMIGTRRQDFLNDVTANVGSTFLGLSVGCARCHDHKFDPILQTDFYRLQAFFTPIQHADLSVGFLPNEKNADVQRRYEQTVGGRVNQINQIRSELKSKIADAKGCPAVEISDAELDEAIKEKKTPITEADASKLNALQSAPEHLTPEQRFEPRLVAIRHSNKDELKETFVLNNGDPFDPGEKVTPGFLSAAPVWSEEMHKQVAASDGSAAGRRKLLAAWLTDAHNPITPRVLVNRIWHYHFGAGIVATPNDFGRNGTGPSHPELLDYLARKLVAGQWRLKPLHRELVLSRSYRTSVSHPDVTRCDQADPENRLLWRSHYRRLEAEVIRDAVLAVSGRLRFETGGPGFFEALPAGMGSSYSFFKWKPSPDDQRQRRSIYMFQRRNLVHPMMEAFDGADLNLSCERRGMSVTAPQALSLFNGRFAMENSLHLAKRIRDDSDDDAGRVDRLFWLAFSRAPTGAERAMCVTLLQEKRKSYADEAAAKEGASDEQADHDLSALRDLSLAVLNANEFVYLD